MDKDTKELENHIATLVRINEERKDLPKDYREQLEREIEINTRKLKELKHEN